jgi:hypothetical protein
MCFFFHDIIDYYYNRYGSINVCIYTYFLTPWSRVLLEKLTGFAASQEIPRKFVTVLPSARHLSLFWARSIQSPPPPLTSWRSLLILSSHLRLGLPNVLFPSGFPTKTLCTTLPSPIRATCPAHLILLDFTTRTILGKEYRSLSSSLFIYIHIIYIFIVHPKFPLTEVWKSVYYQFVLESLLNTFQTSPVRTTLQNCVLVICTAWRWHE